MQFFSKLFNFATNVEKLESQASDVLELHDGFKLLRVKGDIYFVDKNNKIVLKEKDTLPHSPAHAALEAMKKLKENKLSNISLNKKSKEIWTCNFREAEQRWVWYKNAHPKITVQYTEIFSNKEAQDSLENKFVFNSIKFGISVIADIQQNGISKAAKQINALVLENSFTTIKCAKCNHEDAYTIDDLVDQNKMAKYDANFVVCTNCNELVKLLENG
jgi:hypothetical protein